MEEVIIGARPPLAPERAQCFAAECSGSRLLSGIVGRPLALVAIASDAREIIGDLNRKRHGAASLWPEGLFPLRSEDGWDDWSLVELAPACEIGSSFGAEVSAGVIGFGVPAGLVTSDVAAQMSMALRPRRVQEVVIQPEWLEKRSSDDLVVHPRYTPSAYGDARGATLVTDLVAFDASEEAGRLVWLLVGACMAACERRRPWWS